ncbi:MAG: glycoside hydrolase family 31 protein [Bacteroidota bacterium]|nr:glycoside hydrolase family 31 protein [Bacteroidota bacterium]
MKRFLAFAAAALASLSLFAQNPVANPKAVVTEGNARFTVLTDRLIRMEWAADGQFEDRASLAIINRDLPVPSFSRSRSGKTLTIKTDALTLTYKGGRFDKDNLEVRFKLNGSTVTWFPGKENKGNLRGTTRTLDGSKGFSQISFGVQELEEGILSRDGWALVDESQRHLLQKDSSDWGEWVALPEDEDRMDLYLFAYGHDYLAALKDFTRVAGEIPLPPRYVFGYWWSRYWAYTDEELLALADEMRTRDIPADVFIIDMDWHLTWPEMDRRLGPDEFGQSRGWTGYSWNHDLIPDPEGLLNALHDKDFKVALNLHPASGIRPYEDAYDAFVEDYLARTEEGEYDGPVGYVYPDGGWQYQGNDFPTGTPGYRAPVPFRLDQQTWADAYFATVIRPMEKQGVDFWWLDWQQWRESKYVPGLSNTFWCNYAFWNDKVRQTRSEGLQAPRPLIYHRWGGLGSHRYQLGFSGDTFVDWEVLRFLPYFTATASNVGYGYWGHDIGGHMLPAGVDKPRAPELFTRWMQFGVFTPIFKTHSTKNALLDCRIWAFPEYYPMLKAAIDLRYSLAPYIYNAAHNATVTGVSLCRPLYYYYPETEAAYTWNEEYFFGDDIIATAITEPVGADGTAPRKVWLPGGRWYDMAHHRLLDGGQVHSLRYKLDENPWFVRAGAVLPLSGRSVRNLQDPSDPEIRLLVIPGGGSHAFDLYQDDGLTQSYVQDFATTHIEKTTTSDRRTVIKISPRQGSFAGAPDSRRIVIELEGVVGLRNNILLNGNPLGMGVMSLRDGRTVITLPDRPASEALTVEVRL